MNKFIKNSVMLMATIALFLLGIIGVSAAPQQITLGPATQTGRYIAGVGFSYKKTTDGKFLYCIDMNKDTAQNTTASLISSPAVNGGTYYILKNGYPEKSITGDTDKDYYITQTAIWWYLDETTGSHNLGDMFKHSGSDDYGLRSKVKSLVDAGVQHKNDAIPSEVATEIALSASSNSMTLSNGYYVSESIGVSKLTNTNTYTVKLTNAPDGTIISKNGGMESNYTGAFSLKNNETFRVKIPSQKVTDTSLSIKIDASASGAWQYTLNAYKPAVASMQSIVLLDKVKSDACTSMTLEIASSKVSVLKIDTNTKQPLAGAVLVLKDATGKEITRWTSTVNAHVIRNLSNGDYTVEEISAPTGYRLNKNVAKFTISDSRRDIRVNFENAPEKIVVNISKVDQQTKNQLAGAVLVIKNARGEIVYKFETKTTPESITDLEYGTYTVEELSAPEGYIKSNNVVTFTIDKDHLSHQIVIENAKEVIVPDTANPASMLFIMLGIAITGFGISYIKKNGQKRFSK